MAAAQPRTIHIIGVRMDLGGGRRGVDMGPSALRIAGIGERLAMLGHNVFDHGDVDTPIPETRTAKDESKRYIREIAKVCQKVYQMCGQALAKGGVPRLGHFFLSSSTISASTMSSSAPALAPAPAAPGASAPGASAPGAPGALA